MCVYTCLRNCHDPASPSCAHPPHQHHLRGLAGVHAGDHITANHVFIGNSISPTHWDDLYPDTGLYLARRIVSQIEKASGGRLLQWGPCRGKYRNVRRDSGWEKIVNVWVFPVHSGAKQPWIICYTLPCGVREIHLHINAIVQLCRLTLSVLLVTTGRQCACIFPTLSLLYSTFHSSPKIQMFSHPCFHTVIWIWRRCSPPFGIINIMRPIRLSISR